MLSHNLQHLSLSWNRWQIYYEGEFLWWMWQLMCDLINNLTDGDENWTLMGLYVANGRKIITKKGKTGKKKSAMFLISYSQISRSLTIELYCFSELIVTGNISFPRKKYLCVGITYSLGCFVFLSCFDSQRGEPIISAYRFSVRALSFTTIRWSLRQKKKKKHFIVYSVGSTPRSTYEAQPLVHLRPSL